MKIPNLGCACVCLGAGALKVQGLLLYHPDCDCPDLPCFSLSLGGNQSYLKSEVFFSVFLFIIVVIKQESGWGSSLGGGGGNTIALQRS